MATLDSFDWKILSTLQLNSRQTGEQLSETVGLSAAACLRRLQRLRKIGAIEREIAIVSPSFLPKSTQIIIRMKVGSNNPAMIEDLIDRLCRQPEVDRIFGVTGEDDVVMIVRCESMEHFADFIEAHIYEPFIEFVSLVVLREYPKLPPKSSES